MWNKKRNNFFLQLEGMMENWAHPFIFVGMHWGAEISEEAEHDFIEGKLVFYLEVRKRAEDANPSTSWLFGTSLGLCHPHLHPGTAALCCSNLILTGIFLLKNREKTNLSLHFSKEKISSVLFPLLSEGSGAETCRWSSREFKLFRVPLNLCIFISISFEMQKARAGMSQPKERRL